jgi:hypothetical protein
MRTLTTVLVATVLVTSALAVPVAAQSDTATLTVTVQGPDDTAVPGAELSASWDGGSATETTAGNGKAFIDVPAGANVTIDVSSDQYVRNQPFVVTNASSSEITIDVAPKAELVVEARESSGPVADAQVIVRKGGAVIASGQTDDGGEFATGTIEAGEYGVTVRKRGYYRNSTTLDVSDTTETTLTVRQGSVTLQFNVTDPHFSPPEPVGGVTLALDSVGEFQTLSSGEQDVRVPVNAELELTASKDEYRTVSRTIDVEETARSVNVSISRREQVNLTPVSSRIVAGEVAVVRVTNEYDEPIEGATVRLDGESVSETDEDGEATVRIGTAGEHTLSARARGITSASANVTALQGDGTTATPTGTATATPSPTQTGGTVPGFTVTAALLAVLVTFVLLRRRG